MNKLLVSLFMGDEKKKEKNSFIWNMIASLLYSLQSAILLLVVKRAGGLAVGGIFAIAYSISHMFSNIGTMSMREYQVSDYNNKYSFANYAATRFITVPAMIILCLGYALMHGYSGEKLAVLFFLLIYRCVDAIDEMLHAEIQKRGRFDVCSRIWSVRIFIASFVFSVVYLLGHNLIIASVVMAVVAIVVSFYLNLLIYRNMGIVFSVSFERVFKLIKEVIPVCVGAFLYSYLVNAPKVAIDSVLSPEMQTIFNVVFLPTFVINMFSFFVVKPYVLKMGELWGQKKIGEFAGLILKIVAVIFGLTVLAMAAGYLLGIPVLGAVYGIDLSAYRMLLVVLLFFGGVTALASLGMVVITVMRMQYCILISYALAMVVDLLLMNKLVLGYELWGAGLVYGMAISVVFVAYSLFITGGLVIGVRDSKK